MRIQNSKGLSFEFLENGSIKSIDADPIRISLKPANPYTRSGANLYLRKRTGPFRFTALLGPESNSRFEIKGDEYIATGTWEGLEYACILQLSKHSLSWNWGVSVKNTGNDPVELDLLLTQDVGLKPVNAGLPNEYYVSQYLERLILKDPAVGAVACCRQNMRESTGHPWMMLACKNGAVAGCTDGMQFYGKSYRATGIPEGLLSDRMGGNLAGESPVIALQAQPFTLAGGESRLVAFTGTYLPDHPEATSKGDLKRLEALVNEFDKEMTSLRISSVLNEMSSQNSLVKSLFDSNLQNRNYETQNEMSSHEAKAVKNLFQTASLLPVSDLTPGELGLFFGSERRHPEFHDSQLLSFFNDQHNHIVLREKELLTDRPHAHIMQALAGFAPDERIMSTTAFMFGVFNSHISQGNTNFNVLLSICTSQFNQSPESGQRIFVEIDDRYYLLGVPSAFEIGLNHCRWIYKHDRFCFQIRSWTSRSVPQINMDFSVLSGTPVRLLITHSFDPLNGWSVEPGSSICESVAIPSPESMIRSKFPQPRFRMIIQSTGAEYSVRGEEALYRHRPDKGSELFVIETGKTSDFCISFIGEVCGPVKEAEIEDREEQFLEDCREAMSAWKELSLDLSLESSSQDIAAIREILPWYGMNALTHYLTPYGLEQFSGAAWGTRDVSQGPIDLLLAMEKFAEARAILLTLFSNQNPDGGWPQWWMFDSYQEIRAGDSHGDVFYWCLLALASYIKVTGDLKILDEIVPYYHPEEKSLAEMTPLSEHADRLIKMIIASFIPGTSLVPFGGGDWNDSLQPVSKELAERMISSWTVEMNYLAFSSYKDVFGLCNQQEKADMLTKICRDIRSDFNKYLVKDGIVAGYGLVESPGKISVLLHPSDERTGIRYSLLPMERGILSGLFTREQALYHQELIERHLKGPDGARLMDRPLKYKGGIQEIFQRAESSTFFGREIGLMYVHEHIRYAESLAKTGQAEAFVKALRQAIPVAYKDAVPCGDLRQSNCYYSSSDVTFSTRYEADERYEEVIRGALLLKGGWRVYSSGPGIYIGLIVQRLLGIRIGSRRIILDPVLTRSMDGLSARIMVRGHAVTFRYLVKDGSFSPKAISINGNTVPFDTEENTFRPGGAAIQLGEFLRMLDKEENVVEINL